MRSLLFVPGDSPRKLEKGLASGADVLLIDLEDSVSAENKQAARTTASDFIRDRRAACNAALFVRVNALDTGMTGDDLEAVMPAKPAGIMLPKCASGDDIEWLSGELTRLEAKNTIDDGTTAIIPIISETAGAVLSIPTYRPPLPRVAAVTWGAEDLSADIGAEATRNADGQYADVFRLARALTLLAGSAAGVASVDTVFVDFRDTEGLAAECAAAAKEGFTGKMAIHPAQVPVINTAFTPSAEAVAAARTIVEAFAAAGDPGVVGIDGKMYDRPHLKRAERILLRARDAGLV